MNAQSINQNQFSAEDDQIRSSQELDDEVPDEPHHLDDGIQVTVHASEDEFIDSDDEICFSQQPVNLQDKPPIIEQIAEVEPQPGTSGMATGNVGMAPQWCGTAEEFKEMVNQMVLDGIKQGMEVINRQTITGNVGMTAMHTLEAVNQPLNLNEFEQISTPVQKIVKETVLSVPKIKSPSDTTLYTQALHKSNPVDDIQEPVVDRIANFVENIRLQTPPMRQVRNSTPQQPLVQPAETDPLVDVEPPRDDPELAAARARTEKILLESEKFKVNITAPQGRLSDLKQLVDIDENILRLREMDSDDDFFHVTCHADQSVKTKIEAGEFIDLERLLPKEKGGMMDCRDEQQLELVTRGGNTFFAPRANERKINGIRKWEQAFCVFAAIYCHANPSRSAEIWEYVYIINSAASVYSWECVSFYDQTFRQLMATKPMRSWSKTYLQGWNLALNTVGSQSRHGGGRASSDRSSGAQTSAGHD